MRPPLLSLAVAKVTSSQLRAANLVQMFGRRVAAKHKLRRKIRTMQRAVSLHRAQSVRRVVIVSAASGWKIYSELEVFDENQKADVIKFFKDIGLPHTTAIGSPDYPYGASSKLPDQSAYCSVPGVCVGEMDCATFLCVRTDAQITKVDTAAHQHLMRHLSSKRSAPRQGYTSTGMRSASACTSARRL